MLALQTGSPGKLLPRDPVSFVSTATSPVPSFMGGSFISRMLGRMNPFETSLFAKKKGIRLIVTLECTEARPEVCVSLVRSENQTLPLSALFFVAIASRLQHSGQVRHVMFAVIGVFWWDQLMGLPVRRQLDLPSDESRRLPIEFLKCQKSKIVSRNHCTTVCCLAALQLTK